MGRVLTTAVLCLALAGQPLAQHADEGLEAVVLLPAVADSRAHFGTKEPTLGSLQIRLPLSVRIALNRWAPVALALGMDIAVGQSAEVVLIGKVSGDELERAAGWMDSAADVIAPLLAEQQLATVAFLFDRKGMQSDAWAGLMNAFVEQRVLDASTAAHFAADPGGITMRQAAIFVQPTFDMAGDAAAGDDEFRLGNEIAAKFTHVQLAQRYGPLPEMLRWGVGFVVEQRLFQSIYQFNAAGFVATEDHFDWPARTRDLLAERMRDKSFSLGDAALSEAGAGQAVPAQMLTWASLDYLLAKKPDTLSGLLFTLSGLHDQQDEHGLQPAYQGTRAATTEAVGAAWEAVDGRKLKAHLKKVK